MDDNGDLEHIKAARMQERLAARAEADRRDALEIWPTPCPRCYAEPGERCVTRVGKRAMRHVGRG